MFLFVAKAGFVIFDKPAMLTCDFISECNISMQTIYEFHALP